jgi:hypothetical protein
MPSEGLAVRELKGERDRQPADKHVLPELVQETQVGMLPFGKPGCKQTNKSVSNALERLGLARRRHTKHIAVQVPRDRSVERCVLHALKLLSQRLVHGIGS